MRKILIGSLTALILTTPLTAFANDNSKGNKPNQNTNLPAPSFDEASVHDPSIIKADDTFYAIGSHIDAAKSEDLMSWSNFTNGYTTPGNTLYGDLSENLAGSFEWAGEDDADSSGGFAVWAPEVIWNEHYQHEDGSEGAYMMYYSASSTYIRSAIGYAVAKDVEGPYEYVDTIMYSGFYDHDAYDDNSDVNKNWENTNLPDLIDEGVFEEPNDEWFTEEGEYNYNEFTNAIDANLFFDEDGTMWMAYGSWAGGIFILEVDPQTGQPMHPGEDGVTEDGRMIDRYFGTKISGGYGRSGEGPYVTYDEETGYYYLYVTYGGLASDGGYQMRSFRAENPEGPYEDAAGDPAVLPDSLDDGEARNRPDSHEHAEHGNKLMGNFLFDRKAGDAGTGLGHGYMAPGHNSVYTDPDTGKRFLVFHTRFPERGEMHELRVHQMFENEDGWLVASPYRYAGEELSKVNRQDLTGDYKFINHGDEITSEIEYAQDITLTKNNRVTGDAEGKWKKTGHNKAEITIDGQTYKGVFVEQWDETSEAYVMTFTAMSDEGVTVWGSQLETKTDEEIVQAVINDIDLGDTSNVIADLSLPTEGTRQSQISWTTSDENAVTNTGEIFRPESGSDPVSAVLTATVAKGNVSEEVSFEIHIPPYPEAGLTAHYSFDEHLEDTTENFDPGTPTGDRIDVEGNAVSFADGKLGNALSLDGSSGVRLPDGLLASNTYTVSLWLNPEELSPYTTSFFGARNSDNWISLLPDGFGNNSNSLLWSASSTWYDAPAQSKLPAGEWTHVAFTVDEGDIHLYFDGEEQFSGSNFPDIFTTSSGVFGLGVNYWDDPYKGLMDDLQIYEGALSPEEIEILSSQN